LKRDLQHGRHVPVCAESQFRIASLRHGRVAALTKAHLRAPLRRGEYGRFLRMNGSGDELRTRFRQFALGRLLEIGRYGFTGALSVGLNLLVIVFLTERLKFHYLVSISVCFVTVTFVSFCLNRVWTFRKRESVGSQGDLVRYAVLTLTQLPLSLGASSLCVEVFHMPYPIAVIVVSLVFVPTTYLMHRRWSFGLRWREQRPRASPLS
jgi:putative flippase GtrA